MSLIARITDLIAVSTPLRSEDIAADARFAEDLGLASLEVVLLVSQVADEMHVALTDADLGTIRTVRDLVDLIERRKTDGS